jgi:hypothetical protein
VIAVTAPPLIEAVAAAPVPVTSVICTVGAVV